MRTLNTIKYLRLILILTSVSASTVFGQTKKESEGGVGIGTTQPDQSAILDLSSKSKGLLLPRMTLTERANILSPAQGLMVFQTNMLSGLYVYNSNKWSLVSGSNAGANLEANDATTWGTAGNSGLNSSEHFIGTTDTTSIQFKVNNFASGTIDYRRGMSSFGYKAGFLSKGYNSVIVGALAMQKANTGGNNVAIGYQTLFNNDNGDHNVAIGSGALAANGGSEKNTALGSLAGYKSTGKGNVFLGFQAGYFESSNNKLHISNDAGKASLIYGDFDAARVGINTTSLTSAFTINSGKLNTSGLSFEKLNSNSPATNGNRKVLALNSSGEVVLVNDYYEPKSASNWQLNGNDLVNNNSGNVLINRDATIGGILRSNAMFVENGGLTLSGLGSATGKFLSLDANGKVTLVNAPISSTPTGTSQITWNVSGGDISNNNVGLVNISNGLKFSNFNSNSPSTISNGKVLSVDSEGKVILVNDKIGTSGTTTGGGDSGFWSLDSEDRVTNTDRKVRIQGNLDVEETLFTSAVFTRGLGVADYGIKFMTINANSNPQPSNGKALSVNSEGYVILTSAPSGSGGTTVTDGFWKTQNGTIVTQNNEKVVIGAGITKLPDGFNLYVKNGILAERVRVAVANSDKWADYVFDRSYKLMPIKDVAKFIEEYKHLPNVPSAQEVAENGIDMAEIAAKQMEKIEELTLYIIQANERIEKLEAEVAAMKK
ncbi:hypothetical protein SAMN06298216_3480 [Spirosomataceae bacterium TFI 002]|nr:hypothetical protein SAMN06298216_3480 [Spirosomataceae bacterium TFI 002]